MTQEHNVLLALSANLQTAEDLARTTQLPVESVDAALKLLAAQGLAISEDGKYELTGPLSWFGTFDAATRYFARRDLHMRTNDDAIHLYVIDIRVKSGRPVGDPLTETVAVFACGATAAAVRPAPAPLTCEECLRCAP